MKIKKILILTSILSILVLSVTAISAETFYIENNKDSPQDLINENNDDELELIIEPGTYDHNFCNLKIKDMKKVTIKSKGISMGSFVTINCKNPDDINQPFLNVKETGSVMIQGLKILNSGNQHYENNCISFKNTDYVKIQDTILLNTTGAKGAIYIESAINALIKDSRFLNSKDTNGYAIYHKNDNKKRLKLKDVFIDKQKPTNTNTDDTNANVHHEIIQKHSLPSKYYKGPSNQEYDPGRDVKKNQQPLNYQKETKQDRFQLDNINKPHKNPVMEDKGLVDLISDLTGPYKPIIQAGLKIITKIGQTIWNWIF